MMSEEKPKFDPKLEEGVAYFEQMLQIMPDDRTSLEFLCVAYEQLGNDEKRRHSLVRLASALINEGDLDAAEQIGERLATYDTPDAQAAILKIRNAREKPAADKVTPDPQAQAEEKASVQIPDTRQAINAEIDFVQALIRFKVIDEQVGYGLISKLSELADTRGRFLISALAILEKENPALAETVAAYICDTVGAPPIPIESYDLAPFRDLLPEPIVQLRGTIPFAKLNDHLLIATVNPLDVNLKKTVEAIVHAPCSFFLSPPQPTEEALEKLFTPSESPAKPKPAVPAAPGNANEATPAP